MWLTISLVMLVAGLVEMAFFVWAWHQQQYPDASAAFYSAGLILIGAGGLVMRGPPKYSRYFDEEDEEDEEKEEDDYLAEPDWEEFR
jgi:hypothetical protein